MIGISVKQVARSSSVHTMADVKAAKKALRTHIKHVLVSTDADAVRAQSQRAQETLLALPQYQQAKSLSVYLSMPTSEASTELIVRHALQAGKRVFVPHMYKVTAGDNAKPSKYMDMLRLDSLEDYLSLKKDSWGIPTLSDQSIASRDNAMGGQGLVETRQHAEPHIGQLDMIVMPAVAFDREMRRLGHGAGYYDAFLSRYTAIHQKPFLGACLYHRFL